MTNATYMPPVSQLLTIGDVREQRHTFDYLKLGVTTEHVPELARMALDETLLWADSKSDEV